jgi:hypothetical protein
MSEPLVIRIESNAAEVVKRLGQFPPAMQAAIGATLNRENELTVGDIQASKLSHRGPRTLGVVTNRLRSSLRAAKAVVTAQDVDSSIGTNVSYAGAHEFGFQGTVPVRAHIRLVHTRQTVGGYKFLDPKTGKIRTKKNRKVAVATGYSTVRAHTRRMDIPERAFIRSTLAERAPRYGQALSTAIVGAWEGRSS